MKITMLENEYWYGACVEAGMQLPFDKETVYKLCLEPNETVNQASPLLLSSLGRYLWGEDGFSLSIESGELCVTSKGQESLLFSDADCLRGAYLKASERFFPPSKKAPPDIFFTKPQYNTWIELIYDQNQADVIKYADSIVENGLPAGILMIDDGWAECYGGWEFHSGRFPDPKGMIDHLHKAGFTIMLWMCPFITPDSAAFRLLQSKDCLVKNPDGATRIVEWWNGHSAMLDLTHPSGWEWLKQRCDTLVEELHIDGFKLDAGDGYFYRDTDKTYSGATASEQSMLWNKFGLSYPFNEYRACYRYANQPLVQRIADKGHRWDANGVSSLVPNTLAQGILGYAYTCPDMIGGGSFSDFLPGATSFDHELMQRYCAVATLMPMMQFSAAPWRLLTKEEYEGCLKLTALHTKYADYILELVQHSAKTGEPIVRYMEYEFPHCGFEKITDQFMLGSKILVAPIMHKGKTERRVQLPSGRWKAKDSTIYEGGCQITVAAPISELPYFIKAE